MFAIILSEKKSISVKINYVESKENVVDILTKGLERPAFKYLSSKLGMVDISERQH
jgi:hypothetical protein